MLHIYISEMTDAAPQSSTSTPDVEVDGTSSSHETLRGMFLSRNLLPIIYNFKRLIIFVLSAWDRI